MQSSRPEPVIRLVNLETSNKLYLRMLQEEDRERRLKLMTEWAEAIRRETKAGHAEMRKALARSDAQFARLDEVERAYPRMAATWFITGVMTTLIILAIVGAI